MTYAYVNAIRSRNLYGRGQDAPKPASSLSAFPPGRTLSLCHVYCRHAPGPPHNRYKPGIAPVEWTSKPSSRHVTATLLRVSYVCMTQRRSTSERLRFPNRRLRFPNRRLRFPNRRLRFPNRRSRRLDFTLIVSHIPVKRFSEGPLYRTLGI